MRPEIQAFLTEITLSNETTQGHRKKALDLLIDTAQTGVIAFEVSHTAEQAVFMLMEIGERIKAIKLIRMETHWELKQAKDWVESAWDVEKRKGVKDE